MKFCILWFVCCVIIVSAFHKEIKTLSEIKSEKNSAISSAFSNVIREFLIKNHLEFDLIILREATSHINSVINEIMKQLNGEFPCQIRFIASVDDWDHKLYKSAIFFMPTLEDLKNFHSRSITNEFEKQLNHFFPMKLKFLIYVEELKEITDLADYVKIMLRPNYRFIDARFFEFFLINGDKNVSLLAKSAVSPGKCGKFGLISLNKFRKSNQTWIRDLSNFNHYDNFYGCKIDIELEFSSRFYVDNVEDREYFGMNSYSKESLTEIDYSMFRGMNLELTQAMAYLNNFNVQYCLHFDEAVWIIRTRPDQSCFNPLVITETVTDGLRRNTSRVETGIFQTQSFRFTEFYYLVSPNDFYTNYEKLLMPFDLATWVLLWMTFGFTFVVIFIVNKMPKKFRVAVYGDRVNMPTYNAVGVFFGIGQTKLPKENFSRIEYLLH
jgi:hypothetical protein